MGFRQQPADEYYRIAYEKGIYLRPPNYRSAIGNFITASEKYDKEGNPQRAHRARANAALYEFIMTRDYSCIAKALVMLQSIPEIESIGRHDEVIKTDTLIAELTAIQFEIQAESASDSNQKKEFYSKASETIMKLGSNPLNMIEQLKLPGPLDKGISRAYYYSALSDYHIALSVMVESPANAHDYFQRALAAFRQAQAEPWVERVATIIQNISMQRCCWMCGREMYGKDIFYKYYPARIEKYHSGLLAKLKQDTGMIDCADNVTLCTVCGSAIERQADSYATKRANELKPILAKHQQMLDELETRVRYLEQLPRKH